MTLPFPNVPFAPGVPPIPRPPGAVPQLPTLLTGDASGLSLESANPVQWGLFDVDGNSVVAAESVVTFDAKQDYVVSDYPIEQGAFETYNKVQVPFDVRLRYSAGSSDEARAALIASARAVISSFDLYDVYTPETVFSNVSVVHWDIRRTARNGVGLVTVDLWCLQVRLLSTPEFGNVQAPASATAQDGGSVQPQTATSQQQALSNALTQGASSGATTGTIPSTEPGVPGTWVTRGDNGLL